MVESVYSAVRADSLYQADYVSPLKGYCSAEFTVLAVYYMMGNKKCPYQLKM
jgi:hypothetical protein